MRRAKIVCTLGPATADDGVLDRLIAAGLDVARMNFSHGSHADHAANFHRVRAAADKHGKAVALLADLQGPKIRLGRFAHGAVDLVAGATFTITTDDVAGDVDRCSTTYKGLPGDVKVGDPLLIDDGRLVLTATAVTATDVVTTVVVGGPCSNNKGINLPGAAVSVPALSEKDIEDLRYALRLGVDWIALSFVRSAEDYRDVRRIMDEEGIVVPVVAKIEKPQAVDNLEEVVDAFDGIMIARGDLGVEMPLEVVPLVQKRAISLARQYGKPVIVATQMLETMISAQRPTRAEVSDVANAVLDGADALMLSGETSVGEDPVHVVQTMASIIEYTENGGLDRLPPLDMPLTDGTARAVTHAAAEVAEQIQARYLVAFTETGTSAALVARHRSRVPVLAFTPNEQVRNQLALLWGVETFCVAAATHTDDMVRQVDLALLNLGRVTSGERIVVVAGVPPGVPGTTNGIRVHRIGHAVV
ncbi:MAG: pyruvate kinase [Actinomycetota bacterium]